MTDWLGPVRRWFGSKRHQPTGDIPKGDSYSQFNDATEATEFVEELLRLGYLSFTPRADHEMVRDQLVNAVVHGSLLTEFDESDDGRGGCPDRRLYQSDAEDLSEGIAHLVEDLAPILNGEGVRVGLMKDLREDGRVSLMIGDDEYLIYDWPDQEPPDLDTWGLGHKRLVEIVTGLLVAAGSDERLYGIGSHNDAHVILLNEDQFTFIRSSSLQFDDYLLPKRADQMILAHEL